jgi:branched-chain amino acid transport system permease protein
VEFVLQLLFAGICVGSTYALIAMGLTLTFWTTRTMNFGQGSLMMVGAVAAALCLAARVPPAIAAVAGVGLAGALMLGVERVAIAPLLKSAGSMGWVVSTLGFGLFVQGFVTKYLGAQPIAFPPLLFDSLAYVEMFGIRLSAQYLAVFVLSVTLMIVMEVFLRHSRWGRAVRAVAHDADVAALAGIPVRRVVVLSFVASGCLAGAAGILVCQITGTADPQFGFNLIILGFVAAVVGGMGSILGALVGGIALGVAEKMAGGFVSTALGDAMAFAILMAVLAARPQGLFGQREVAKV